jgi:ubiquinone/menaquinone biosynthesis C-methylase UbiE
MKEKREAEFLNSFCLAAREKGWEEAVVERYGNLDKAPWIADSSRADPLLFSNLNEDSNILDLASGYGVLSFAISTLCRSVTSLDTKKEYADFIKIRAQQDGITNITPLLGDFTRMPFRESSFDLIILNNGINSPVLKKNSNSFLRRIHILLKPTGQVYIVIDRHKRKFNAFSNSYKRFQHQLSSAGFHVHKVLIPLKRYENFKFILDYENQPSFHFFLELLAREYTASQFGEKLFKKLLKIINLTRLNTRLFMHLTSASYLIIAQKV